MLYRTRSVRDEKGEKRKRDKWTVGGEGRGRREKGGQGAARLGRKDYREEMRRLRRIGMGNVGEYMMGKRTREEGIT